MSDQDNLFTPEEIEQYETVSPGLGLRMIGLLEEEARRQHQRTMHNASTVRLGLVVFCVIGLALLAAVWSIKNEVTRTVLFAIFGTSILTPLMEAISAMVRRFRTARQQPKPDTTE